MKNIKTYLAAFAIALMTGFGVFSVVTAINAQTTENSGKQNVQKERNDSNDELNESEENEANENEDGDDVDENESEEGEENEADEKAEQAKLAQEATVSRQEAEAIALEKVPGTITNGEIEKEDGKLIWSFDIKNSQDQMFDVEIDAKTGEIIKAQPDDENDNEDEGSETTDQ